MLKKTEHPWIQEKTGGERRLLAAGARGPFASRGKKKEKARVRSGPFRGTGPVPFQSKKTKRFVLGTKGDRDPG